MPLDEMRLMLEQWGNITGEPRGVDYRGINAKGHREEVYFRTSDFFGGAVFFRGREASICTHQRSSQPTSVGRRPTRCLLFGWGNDGIDTLNAVPLK
jgi:hypothetical protein